VRNCKSNRAIFLDRDGVINRAMIRDNKPYPPKRLDELEILSGVHDGLGKLKSAGFLLIVVTNQPDVARGTADLEEIEAINLHLAEKLPIDLVRVCYHGNDDECVCRKPKPGLILQAARELSIDLSESYMVGDRWRDVEAGQAAGCRTIFIDYGYNEKRPVSYDYRVGSFTEAVLNILRYEDI
jgi:D-glycero-D-manno-heptose 1,7-bisphosphate phosphatase